MCEHNYVRITALHPRWVRCLEGGCGHTSSVRLFVFQFDLVCVNAWMLDLTQAILNLGFLAGAFTLGYAADR